MQPTATIVRFMRLSLPAAVVFGLAGAARAAAPPPYGAAANSSLILVLDQPGLLETLTARRGALGGVGGVGGVGDVGAVGDMGDVAGVRAAARAERGLLDRAEAAIVAAQDRTAAQVAALGGRVVGRQRAFQSGLLVHAPAALAPRLQALPEVAAVWPAPLMRPDLAASGPRVGAPALRAQSGWDGQGSVIAVIDTGIDYTHAALGGVGLAAAYQQAAVAAERIDDTWNGQPIFPNAKVIGGYDFVGANYTHPRICTPDKESAGLCSGTPHPDLDPLDQQGHGSHVAGIAAGEATGNLAAGIAPGARLVALKVYGPPIGPGLATDEAVDVVLDALDWCALVNLGRAVPGTAPSHIDVVNMSLSEPWGQGALILERAVAGAVAAGIVVVGSAGNAGGQAFILGAPGASPPTLAVANTASSGSGAAAVDQLSASSSRGPSLHGALKPNLAAPGTGIVSAAMGSGSGGRTLSGTSMSSPHVTGAAAVLAQRSRAQALGLGPRDIAALLVSTAARGVKAANGSGGEAGLSAAGAGRLDLLAAGNALLLPRGGEFAELGFGLVELTLPETVLRRAVVVSNLAAEPLLVSLVGSWRNPAAAVGLELLLPPEPVLVPAGGEVSLEVGLRLTAAQLSVGIGPDEQPQAFVMDRLEVDGQVELRAVDANGRPRTEIPAARMPVQVIPRRAAALRGRVVDGASPPTLRFTAGAHAGGVELYALPQLDGKPAPADPDEPDLALGADLWQLGLRERPATGILDLAVVAREATLLAHTVLTTLYLDRDEDGRFDLRLRHGSAGILGGAGIQGPELAWGLASWDPATATAGAERIQVLPGAPLGSGVLRFSVPLADLGLTEGQPFRLALNRRGMTEDWYLRPDLDWAPDGATATGGPRYRFDPRHAALEPAAWQARLEGGAALEIPLLPVDAGSPALWEGLAIYPDNAGQPVAGQAQRLRPGGAAAYLPLLVRPR